MVGVNAIRNPDGWWINSNVFREEALHFDKNGYFCPDKYGSLGWIEYWTEQLKRCEEGYTVGGVKITGHHYAYLNFSRIQISPQAIPGKRVTQKKPFFPNFWDGDYNYFWNKEIAWQGITEEGLKALKLINEPAEEQLDGGYHMIIGKARRKGFSYKNASIIANTYNTRRDSLSVIGAHDKKYVTATLKMVKEMINFQNINTGFAKHRHVLNQDDHFRASYKYVDERGVESERGYKSEVMGLYFKDNPDAARGKDAVEFFFEEAGKWPGLKQAWLATMATTEDGSNSTGQITAFGTGGDMEKGTVDFADMFYNPVTYGAIAYKNVWDDEEMSHESKCSFFFPDYLNFPPYIDEQGNSIIEDAQLFDAQKRQKIIKASSDTTVLDSHKQEHPKNPKEAFLTKTNSIFPQDILRKQLARVEALKLDELFGTPGELIRKEGKLMFKADLSSEGKLKPFRRYKNQSEHKPKSGCLVVFEPVSKNTKGNDYIIGYDPYAQDDSAGNSLGAIYVYKKVIIGEAINNQIVAYYIGRLNEVDDLNKMFYDLCEYYQSKGMHENMFNHVKTYGKMHKRLQWLQAEPVSVITSVINESKVSRKYGIHMNKQIKDFGEKLIKSWILDKKGYDDDDEPIYNISTCYDRGLLEELIEYDGIKNTDRVMAFMMIMFDYEENKIEKITQEETLEDAFVSLNDFISDRKKLIYNR